MQVEHKFPYKWNLQDKYPAKGIEYHGSKVYSTFACGGGSTMGYKLAGFDVIGANDIDPQMAKVYKENHNPKYYDLCPIGDLLDKELPEEYYNLDILDGSPPCSNFSMAGSREKAWKKDKKFREGQAKQKLSDLFFDWIALVDKLQPKFAIAENVKGMIIGNAKAYTKAVMKELDNIGYDVQLFLLNAASMGVPQKRERVFFICKRKDIKLPKIRLEFNENAILFGEISDLKDKHEKLLPSLEPYYEKVKDGECFSKYHPKGHYFNSNKASNTEVLPTITADVKGTIHNLYKRSLNSNELKAAGSFPQDYNFLDVAPKYLIGMSVPPVMMAQVAHQVYLQWISKL